MTEPILPTLPTSSDIVQETEGEKMMDEVEEEIKLRKEGGEDNRDTEQILNNIELKELESVKEKSIEKINKTSKWDHLKLLSRKYYRSQDIFKLFISKEIKLKGKVTHKEFETLQQISLLKETLIKVGDGQEDKISFFDERIDKKSLINIINSFDIEFWIYKFKSGNKEYFLLTQENEELDLEEYIIEGSLIHFPDYADIGKYSKLNLKIPIILLHSATKERIPFNTFEECLDKFKELKLDQVDNLKRILFSKEGIYYKTPELYEDLLISWLFASKKDNYPLHLMIVGNAGSGKSTTIESLYEKSNETVGIFEGTTSTFKELIPSFKGVSPKVGYVLESNRLCFTDEFLRVLMRVEREERSGYLTFMNTLLEHKKRRMGSGNCSFEGKMSSKLFAVTNPVFGTKDVNSLVNKFEDSITFLSRLLIYYQNNEHLKFINNLKQDKDKLEKVDKINNNFLISMYDFLNSIDSQYNNKRIKEIFNQFKEYLNEKDEYHLIKDMYEARYYHHLECLIDGIIKYRCLMNGDKELIAKEEDYIKLILIMKDIFKGWSIVMIDKERVEENE